MIDIHAHILPGLDDGPSTWEDALALARAFVRAGYRAVVATPHVVPGLYPNGRGLILERLGEARRRLAQEGIDLDLHPGAEYFLDPGLVPALEAGELVTVNDAGRHLLVELPSAEMPAFARPVLFELAARGVTPVLAHPERQDYLARSRRLLEELAAGGVLLQVTCGSLTGMFGSGPRRCADWLLRAGLAHYLATDAHVPGRRLAAAARAHQLLGERGQRLVEDNPRALLQGRGPEGAREGGPAAGWAGG
ncbi:MAG: phosphotransferase [Syntrophomonadaceae bacterium]|nr:phosphotransferase [Syntrophomonadaceae bacterium]